jgi:hypothetical protein
MLENNKNANNSAINDKDRIVAVLPGNGWIMTTCDDDKEEEVLAFIVVEVTGCDGLDNGVPFGVGVYAEIRAVSVKSPFIEYLPYPDEELSYRLVRQQKASYPDEASPYSMVWNKMTH